MMNLVSHKEKRRFGFVRVLPRRATIQQCLQVLGVTLPKETRKSCSFWMKYENDLPYLLHDARLAFKARMKESHPDLGGCARLAQQINTAWGRTKKLFANRNLY